MTASEVSLAQIATHVAGRLEGPPDIHITGLAELRLAQQGELSFLISDADLPAVEQTQASAVLLPEALPPISLPMVRVKDVSEAINIVLELFVRPRQNLSGIHPREDPLSDFLVDQEYLHDGPTTFVAIRTSRAGSRPVYSNALKGIGIDMVGGEDLACDCRLFPAGLAELAVEALGLGADQG